jgi:hypothetical protein
LKQLLGSPTLRSDGRKELAGPELEGSQGRVLDAWDGLGLLGTTAVMALVATWGAVRARPGYSWLPEALFVAGGGAALVVAAGSVGLTWRRSLDVRGLLRRLARVWLDPPHDWVMFGLGFLIAVPALALHADVLVGDSDSARVISSTLYVQRTGLGYLVDTQDNLMPHLTVGPLVALGGIPAAVLFSAVSVQVLVGSVSFLAWKLTRSAAATLAGVVALLAFPHVWERAYLLPLYPLMLAFGFLGLYFAQRTTVTTGRERAGAAILAGACFMLSLEANRIGQFFLAFTLLLFLTVRPRQAAQGLIRVYLVFGVLFMPRAVINYWEGGLERFFSNRTDYWVTEGYLALVQEKFFHYPSELPLSTYLSRLGENLDFLFGWTGVAVLALGVVALVVARGPLRRFALICVVMFVAALLYQRVPFFPRYFSPFMVAGALGAGVVIRLLLQRSAMLRGVAMVALLALVVAAGVTYVDAVDKAERRQAPILAGPIPEIVREIDDGKGVIGARSGWLLFVSPKVKPYGGQFLTEDEYVTYLTWPSDGQVIEVLRKHDIGWVVIGARRRLEIDYHNAWLEPAHGQTARHVQSVRASPNFCEVLRISGYVLYKLGLCPSRR